MIRRAEVLGFAARGVTRNRRRTLIAATMVTLGVVAVIFCRGYIAGLQDLMTDSLVQRRYGAMQVSQRGYHASAELAPLDVDLPATGELADTIRRVPGVTAIAGRLLFLGMIQKGDTTQLFGGLGIDRDEERKVCPHGPASNARTVGPDGTPTFQLVDGPGLGAPDGVLLGRELATSLGAKVGDLVTLVVQTKSGSVDAVDTHVAGIYVFDDLHDNRYTVVTPLALAQKVAHMTDRVSAFAIAIDDTDHLPRTKKALEAALKAPSLPPTEVLTWGDLGPYLRDTMKLQDRVLMTVMGVIFVLLLTGIANTMLMSVFERTREVGTLMSLGMVRARILLLFELEALILATLAASIGVALGLGLVRLAHKVGLPFSIPAIGRILVRPLVDTHYVALAFGTAIFAALLAALYPAWRASRMNPVDALRST